MIIKFYCDGELTLDPSDVRVIEPLEELHMGRDTDYKYVSRPTEEGKLLLEFIKRHLIA